MIDSSGRKIITEEEQVDIEFLLKEAEFFTKYFHRNENIQTALFIAKAIDVYLTHKKKY